MNDRMRRVNEAMREVLSDALTQDLKDPRVGFVTVTAVETSPDLRHAHVYVSVLGDAAVRDNTIDGLQSAHGYLQRLALTAHELDARIYRAHLANLRRRPRGS